MVVPRPKFYGIIRPRRGLSHMIRFLLPALLLILGACQAPNAAADCTDCSGPECTDCAVEASMDGSCCEEGGDCADCDMATKAALMVEVSDCDAGSCESEAAMDCESMKECDSMKDCDSAKECDKGATQVGLMTLGEQQCEGADASCAMKAAGVCDDEGKENCPMEAAGNETCSKSMEGATQVALTEEGSCAMKAAGVCDDEGKENCPMEAAGNETCSKSMEGATQVALTEEGSCASKSECSTEAKAECSSEAKSECSSKEAPAAVKTGAVAEPVKEEVPPCCASKKADPSS